MAIATYKPAQTGRFPRWGFLDKFETWDHFILDNARLCHDAMRDLAEANDGKLIVSANVSGSLPDIDFTANDIEENFYELQIEPTSMLPTTPAGKNAYA